VNANYFAPELGRKRRRTFAVKVIETWRRFALRCDPLCFALKWFWPGLRAMSFPLRVTRIRFV